jgi:hypothetical protein
VVVLVIVIVVVLLLLLSGVAFVVPRRRRARGIPVPGRSTGIPEVPATPVEERAVQAPPSAEPEAPLAVEGEGEALPADEVLPEEPVAMARRLGRMRGFFAERVGGLRGRRSLDPAMLEELEETQKREK